MAAWTLLWLRGTSCGPALATRFALARLPNEHLRGRQKLIRADFAGGDHEFVSWLAQPARQRSYSASLTTADAIDQHVSKIPASAWTPAGGTDTEVP